MLSKGFKIVSPNTFEIYYEDVNIKANEALVKIDMAAICKADLRYFLGLRSERILGLKYPMRLLHEAVGTIIKDPTNTFEIGDTVVLVPNITDCSINGGEGNCNLYKNIAICPLKDNNLGENYCPKAKFASSNIDGFSCEYISFPISNIVKVGHKVSKEVAVFSELTSVAMAAMRRVRDLNNKTIALWGDGIVGYILASVLKNKTNSKIIVIGKHEEKLKKFPVDNYYLVGQSALKELNMDISFECVGGIGSQGAINEIIDSIAIGGEIVLTGVSEENIEINTRKILEKGLRLTGTTRSSIEDFQESVKLMENLNYSNSIEQLINGVKVINHISDYYVVFEEEVKNKSLGKTIMKFSI